jgi:hypothetical protein
VELSDGVRVRAGAINRWLGGFMTVESGAPDIPASVWAKFTAAAGGEFRRDTRAALALEAVVPLIEAAAFDRLADELRAKADQRVGDSLAAGERQCDGDCATSDCHAVAAVGTYCLIAARLRRRARALRGEGADGE